MELARGSGLLNSNHLIVRTIPRFAISVSPLETQALVSAVATDRCGAVATFVGLVRDHNAGRRVEWLDYEAYPELALKTLARIGAEAAVQWPDVELAIHHRTGRGVEGEHHAELALHAGR